MTTPAPGGWSPRGLALLALVVVAATWLGLRLGGVFGARAAAGDAADPTSATASAGIAALDVRTVDGRVLALAGAGEPTVVMVSSETCAFCKEALGDIGRLAGGRPLPRLRIVTLEGAEHGVSMVRQANIRGAVLAGPVTPAAEAQFVFAIRGTPTWLALDERGRVTRTMLGYGGEDVLAGWMGVMLGERGRP